MTTQNTRSTYTPGPWHVEASRSPIDGREHIGIWAGGEPMAGDTEVAVVARRSDAPVIALCPRMVEALRAIVRSRYPMPVGHVEWAAARGILAELDGEGTATT